MKDCTGLADANSLKLRPSFAIAKTVKPYNRTHIGTRQECVFAEGKSHRSICLFTFCALHKLLQRRAENVKPYNSTHTRCRQECVFAEGKSHRSICLFTFYALHTILQRRVENVKPYNRTHTGTRAVPPRVRLRASEIWPCYSSLHAFYTRPERRRRRDFRYTNCA